MCVAGPFRTPRCSSSVLSAAAGAVHEQGTFTFVLSHGGGAGELRPRLDRRPSFSSRSPRTLGSR
jgi:hypothetical protein